MRPAALAAAISVMALGCPPVAHALDWRLEPTLGASATYTDNANQSENDPEGAVILSATPGFTLRSGGSRRVRTTLRYGLTGVMRFGEEESTDLLHNLSALGNAELVEDFLFIDGGAQISQQLISLEGPLVEAEISDSNRATVGTYSVSPYIQKRLGTLANANARYTTSGAIFENDVAANTGANSFTAGLTSGTRFDDLSWGLNYFIRKAEYDNAADSTFESASASLGYALTRKFRIFGTVGEDRNDYLSASDTEGSFWSAGFGWSPSRRTSLEASVGERYFGNTYSVSARHRTRASNWNVSYAEDVSDTSQFLLTSGTVYDYLCLGLDGNLIPYFGWQFSVPPDELGEPVRDCVRFGGTPGLVFDLHNGVFISKVLRAGVSWGLGKLNYSLNAFDSLREYQIDNSEDRTQGVTAAVTYRVGPKTSAHGSLGLNHYELSHKSAGGGFFPSVPTKRDDDIYTLTLGVNHQFDPDLSGSLVYQYQQRNSNVANGDFQENRITGTVNMSF